MSKVLKELKIIAKVETFASGNEIPDKRLFDYDVAFLDIDFADENYNGIDLARRLRKGRRTAVIVFVTNYIEYAPEGYEVQAFRYLVKSEIPDKLESYMEQIIAKVNSVKKTMPINVNGEIIAVPIADVLYIESNGHSATIYVQRKQSGIVKDYCFYDSLTNLEAKLEESGFLRVYKSYLVNMERIKTYQCKVLVLDNGTSLKVSERNYGEQKKKYMLWKGWQ